MTLGILTCLWKRHRLECIILQHYARFHGQLELNFCLLAVGSEGPVSREIAEAARWNYQEYSTLPFSDKHAYGMMPLREGDPCAVD